MSMWTDMLDKIFVVNLAKRNVRLEEFTWEMQNYNIPFERVEAIEDTEGARGLLYTVINLLQQCLDKGFGRILIMEDDVKFLTNPRVYMQKALEQLPDDFHLLYLGAYLMQPFRKRFSENLFLLNSALTTHAIVYSAEAVKIILPHLKKMALVTTHMMPLDMLLTNKIVKLYKSYITYPLLATQRAGMSDIMQKEVDYFKYIETSYREYLLHV